MSARMFVEELGLIHDIEIDCDRIFANYRQVTLHSGHGHMTSVWVNHERRTRMAPVKSEALVLTSPAHCQHSWCRFQHKWISRDVIHLRDDHIRLLVSSSLASSSVETELPLRLSNCSWVAGQV